MRKIIFTICVVLTILTLGVAANAQIISDKDMGINVDVPENCVVDYYNDSVSKQIILGMVKGDGDGWRVGAVLLAINNDAAYFDGMITDEGFLGFLEAMVSTENLTEELEGDSSAYFTKKDVYTIEINGIRYQVFDGTYVTSGEGIVTENMYVTAYAWAKNGRIYFLEYFRFSGESDNFRPEEFLAGIDYEPGTIKILVNGTRIYPDTAPGAIEGRILVPIRAVAEEMGYKVDWNAEKQLVTLLPGNSGENTVVFELSQKDYLVNGETYQLDVPAVAINGRTYIPLRAAAESMGALVSWDGSENTAIINQK